LLKTEPEEFSWGMLVERGREPWTGVRNATALKHLRAMAPGDEALIYHTGSEKRIVGIARVVLAAYPDPTAAEAKYVAVDVEPVRRLGRPVTLAQIKADPAFAEWELVRQSRLSVMPVPPELWTRILLMGETNG
jgi:predicted RNA-binding protein with PUA-like domain